MKTIKRLKGMIPAKKVFPAKRRKGIKENKNNELEA